MLTLKWQYLNVPKTLPSPRVWVPLPQMWDKTKYKCCTLLYGRLHLFLLWNIKRPHNISLYGSVLSIQHTRSVCDVFIYSLPIKEHGKVGVNKLGLALPHPWHGLTCSFGDHYIFQMSQEVLVVLYWEANRKQLSASTNSSPGCCGFGSAAHQSLTYPLLNLQWTWQMGHWWNQRTSG